MLIYQSTIYYLYEARNWLYNHTSVHNHALNSLLFENPPPPEKEARIQRSIIQLKRMSIASIRMRTNFNWTFIRIQTRVWQEIFIEIRTITGKNSFAHNFIFECMYRAKFPIYFQFLNSRIIFGKKRYTNGNTGCEIVSEKCMQQHIRQKSKERKSWKINKSEVQGFANEICRSPTPIRILHGLFCSTRMEILRLTCAISSVNALRQQQQQQLAAHDPKKMDRKSLWNH